MERRRLGRTGLEVSPIALGGAPFGYVQRSRDWDPGSTAGQATTDATINAALDSGINYIDTAPAYGDGQSETLIGRAIRTRRDECVLASKAWYELDRTGVRDSVHRSLERLQTSHIDILQIHGRMYSTAEVNHVLYGGPLDALVELQEAGDIGHIGITTEEPWSVLPFLRFDPIEVYQIGYNIIYQGAALHFLPEAVEADVGVVTMRTLTSGVFEHQTRVLAPEWLRGQNPYEVALKFVLADSRVHSGIIGMRWPEEVRRNVELVETWHAPVDLAASPRLTREVYEAEDAGGRTSLGTSERMSATGATAAKAWAATHGRTDAGLG
jgi:aryl-alcohol dehydrogenase-like predicted oxidoreductase